MKLKTERGPTRTTGNLYFLLLTKFKNKNKKSKQVAWLFNIRGSDISFNPVTFAGALLTQENVFLFIDEDKLGDEVKQVFFLQYFFSLRRCKSNKSLPKQTITKKYYILYRTLSARVRHKLLDHMIAMMYT